MEIRMMDQEQLFELAGRVYDRLVEENSDQSAATWSALCESYGTDSKIIVNFVDIVSCTIGTIEDDDCYIVTKTADRGSEWLH